MARVRCVVEAVGWINVAEAVQEQVRVEGAEERSREEVAGRGGWVG